MSTVHNVKYRYVLIHIDLEVSPICSRLSLLALGHDYLPSYCNQLATLQVLLELPSICCPRRNEQGELGFGKNYDDDPWMNNANKVSQVLVNLSGSLARYLDEFHCRIASCLGHRNPPLLPSLMQVPGGRTTPSLRHGCYLTYTSFDPFLEPTLSFLPSFFFSFRSSLSRASSQSKACI